MQTAKRQTTGRLEDNRHRPLRKHDRKQTTKNNFTPWATDELVANDITHRQFGTIDDENTTNQQQTWNLDEVKTTSQKFIAFHRQTIFGNNLDSIH